VKIPEFVEQYFKQHRIRLIILFLLGAMLLVGTIAYLMFGHSVLLSFYQGHSLPIFNNLIEKKSFLTLDYYYVKVDRFILELWALYLSILILIGQIEILRFREQTGVPNAEMEFNARPGKFFSVYWLPFILIVASLFRLPGLAVVPNGLINDEASSGYDAYALSQTGRDQFGTLLPMFARSFGDYDEASYRYLTIPSVNFFGLNEFAVRLPAALAGILTVWVFFLLVKEWFGPPRALLAAFFLAISPWHIQFSRIGLRAILLPLMFCLGLLFFLKALKKPGYLIISSLLFIASLYTYSAGRIFIPLFLLGLAILYNRELKIKPTLTLSALIIFLTGMVFLAFFWISPHGMARAQATLGWNPLKHMINYTTYFSPFFLFFQGGPNLICSLLHMGHLYRFEIFTVLAGLAGLILGLDNKGNKLICIWLVLYPIPAALTQSVHGGRALLGGPLFALLSASGVFALMNLMQEKWKRLALFAGIMFLAVASAVVYGHAYFWDYPIYSARAWDYGWREAMAFARQDTAAIVKVSNAYICVLFYTGVEPSQAQHALQKDGEVHRFGRYLTGPLPELLKDSVPGLVLLRPEEIPLLERSGQRWITVKRVLYPDGLEAVRIVRTF
jgi:4-amino-4-deoxy-L-arabinose transferase-like glycosyltransferase